jgi:hypothetical protein
MKSPIFTTTKNTQNSDLLQTKPKALCHRYESVFVRYRATKIEIDTLNVLQKPEYY